jgi:hypothetical protein
MHGHGRRLLSPITSPEQVKGADTELLRTYIRSELSFTSCWPADSAPVRRVPARSLRIICERDVTRLSEFNPRWPRSGLHSIESAAKNPMNGTASGKS